MSNPYGRLTLIGSVILHLNYKDLPRATTSDRGKLWRYWSDNFFNVEEGKKMVSPWQVGFPALEKLVLDFSSWDLGPRDGVIVRSIVHNSVLSSPSLFFSGIAIYSTISFLPPAPHNSSLFSMSH